MSGVITFCVVCFWRQEKKVTVSFPGKLLQLGNPPVVSSNCHSTCTAKLLFIEQEQEQDFIVAEAHLFVVKFNVASREVVATLKHMAYGHRHIIEINAIWPIHHFRLPHPRAISLKRHGQSFCLLASSF